MDSFMETSFIFIGRSIEVPLSADFTLQEQPEDNLMVAISRAWYNGSYTTATKPINSVELIIKKTGSLYIIQLRDLIGVAAMVYEIAVIKLFSGCFCKVESTRSCNIS